MDTNVTLRILEIKYDTLLKIVLDILSSTPPPRQSQHKSSMLITNSQTLNKFSNNIGGLNNFRTSQLGLGGMLGGANSGDMLQQANLCQQIAALQGQQQQLQNKSLGRGGLLNGLNGGSKYLNGLNNQK